MQQSGPAHLKLQTAAGDTNQGRPRRTAGSSSCGEPRAAGRTPRRPTCGSGVGQGGEAGGGMEPALCHPQVAAKSVCPCRGTAAALNSPEVTLQPAPPTHPPTCASRSAGRACSHSSPARGCCCPQTSPPGCCALLPQWSTPAAALLRPLRGCPVFLQCGQG